MERGPSLLSVSEALDESAVVKIRPRYIVAFALFAVGAGLLLWFFLWSSPGSRVALPLRLGEELGGDDVIADLTSSGADADATRGASVVEEDAIAGQVVTPTGEPAVGARVLLQSPGLDEAVEVTTNRGGMFAAGGLPRRLFAVEATATGYGPATVIGVTPGGAPLRLTLSGGKSVAGLVTMRGQPVGDAVIHLGAAGMFPQRSVTSAKDGSFTVGGLQPGRYEYVAIKEGLSSGYGGVFTIDDDGTIRPPSIVIELREAPAIQLSIVDRRTGEPVDFAIATFSERPVHVLALNAMADLGVARVDYLAPAEYHLSVRAPGYIPYSTKFWVGAEGRTQTIRLSRGARVCGTVRDAAGNGVRGATIKAIVETPQSGRFEMTRGIFERFHRLARPDGAPLFWPASDYVTEQDGNYCIGGLPASQARIVASSPQFADGSSRLLTLQADASLEGIDIVLERGRNLRGRVEDENGEPLLGATVVATDASLPGWITGDTQITDRSGRFEFSDLNEDVRLSARHPEHGMVEQQVSIPDGGLDDFVITLSDVDALRVTGRVLETRTGPASGAIVWLMRGGASVPVCRATTDASGRFTANDCSATPERILIRHDGFAPLNEELTDARNARDWVLRAGGELALVTGRFAAQVSVDPMFNLPEQIWPRPSRTLDAWDRVIVPHVSSGRYRVTCSIEGHAESSVTVEVRADHRAEAVCPLPARIQSFRIYVTDPEGAPVSNALVTISGLRDPVSEVTRADGSITVRAEPGRWATVRAVHERWGQGSLDLQTPREPVEPYRVSLGQPIGSDSGGDFIGMLSDWGVAAVRDRRSVVIDTIRPGSPAANLGLRRQDLILWARELPNSRLSLGLRRQGELLSFELVRQSP